MSNDQVALPHLSHASTQAQQTPEQTSSKKTEEPASETSTVAATSARETPATSQAPSESDFTQVSTPTTPAQPNASSPKSQQHARKDTRTAIAIPNIGGLPKAKAAPSTTEKQTQQPSGEAVTSRPEQKPAESATTENTAPAAEAPQSPPKPAVPKSWADLVRPNEVKTASAPKVNGTPAPNGVQGVPKSASLAEALKQHSVTNEHLSFLEPRGLVNTGNMCYMNSVGPRAMLIPRISLTFRRSFKFLYSVLLSTISSIRSANVLFTR